MDELKISFGASESYDDPRTLSSESFAAGAGVPEHGKVVLDFDFVNDLCNQQKLGICTQCGVRMAAEYYFRDGIRLDEYWGYLIGKLLVQGNLDEGSSALSMLKAANKFGIPEKEFCKKFPLKTTGSYAEFIDDFKKKYGGMIPMDVLENASKHKIPGYFRIFPDQLSGSTPSAASVAAEIGRGRVVIARFVVGDNTHTDKAGHHSNKAKDILPLRPPTKIESGHIWDLNEFWNQGKQFGGPNSWSRRWCADNVKQEAGYFWFDYDTQKPFFTEAWGIMTNEDKYLFMKDLSIGSTGPDVVALQKYLVAHGFMVMPNGVPYGYFGEITKAGLAAYQTAYGIFPSAGYFGPKTRAHLNKNQ